jgi:hypothetical protein
MSEIEHKVLGLLEGHPRFVMYAALLKMLALGVETVQGRDAANQFDAAVDEWLRENVNIPCFDEGLELWRYTAQIGSLFYELQSLAVREELKIGDSWELFLRLAMFLSDRSEPGSGDKLRRFINDTVSALNQGSPIYPERTNEV